jgi:rhomboid domain-containing protein 1
MARNNQQKSKTAVLLLINYLLTNKKVPPVTLAVIALNVIIYLELFDEYFNFPSLSNVCLSVSGILYSRQWIRLVLSALFHGDDWHLYYNMISFSIKGRSLEKRYGSAYFLILLATFTILCSLTYVGLEFLAFYFLERDEYLYSCAVGFSGSSFFSIKIKILLTI